jgi:hypothetical protein
MPRAPRNPQSLGEAVLAGKRRQVAPFEFVLDAMAPLSPRTRPMFGCLAVYVEDKIMVILREQARYPADNGVWLATTPEHHESLRREFPRMRSIRLLGRKETGWQLLPVDEADFEESARRACALILAGDPRIGKVPTGRPALRASRSPRTRRRVTPRQ